MTSCGCPGKLLPLLTDKTSYLIPGGIPVAEGPLIFPYGGTLQFATLARQDRHLSEMEMLNAILSSMLRVGDALDCPNFLDESTRYTRRLDAADGGS